MTDTSTSTDLEAFQGGDLDPATARLFAAQWREAQRLAMTSVIPKTITHRREKVGDRWQDVPQPPAVVKATVFAVVRYGAEVFGYPGPVALGKVDVIEGRLEPRYDALVGRMLDAGHEVRTREMTSERAVLAVRRAEDRNDPDGWQIFEFTVNEAKAAGYIKANPEDRDLKGAWYTRRADMLMSKAAKRAFRLAASDLLVQRGALDLVDGAAVDTMVAPAARAGVIDVDLAELPAATSTAVAVEFDEPAPPADADDEVVDGEIVDPPSPAEDPDPGDAPPEDPEADRARAQAGLMAEATKAFPRFDGEKPAAHKARVEHGRYAITWIALGSRPSANDMTAEELRRVRAALHDTAEGVYRVERRGDGTTWVVRSDGREKQVPGDVFGDTAAAA